jgi:uncharacterized protein (DUF2236 family)
MHESPAAVIERAGALPRSPLRRAFAAPLRRALGTDPSALQQYATPPGDPGLFGEDSPVWAVHGELASMLIGGISALMLQTLHPLAMAGVDAHSRFRTDPYGRLQRTAGFIAGTTFGSSELAGRLIGEVRGIHEKVRGVAPDGRSYSASDPALLTYVHTTEVWSFLRSYQRYAPRPLLAAEKDRYLSEVAVIAERLGALDVPKSVAQLRRYLEEVRPELEVTSAALETVRFLREAPSPEPLERAGHLVICDAAIDLLPGFARSMLSLGGGRSLASPAVRLAARSFALATRWSVGPSVVAEIARARVAAGTN